MMYQWLVFTLVCLACLVTGAIVGIIADRWLRESEQLEIRSKAAQAPRHARTAPRTALVTPKPTPEPDRITWNRSEAVGGPVEIPGKRYADYMRTRMAAANVVLPEPGAYLPQPGRDSGPGTVAFGKLELPAATGEMRAVTDDWIANMQAEEAADREARRKALTS